MPTYSALRLEVRHLNSRAVIGDNSFIVLTSGDEELTLRRPNERVENHVAWN